MWKALSVALMLAHVGSGLVLRRFSVPSSPEYGSTVQLEADYELGAGEYVQQLRWSKDDTTLLTYTEQPRSNIEWGAVAGVTVDQEGSSPSRVVLTSVGDGASGQYTLELSVSGPDGNVANIANSNYMSVGGTGFAGLNTRFSGGGPGVFQSTVSSSSSSSDSGVNVDGLASRGGFQSSSTSGGPGGGQTSFSSSSSGRPGGVQTSFQSSSGGTGFGPNFPNFGPNFPFGNFFRGGMGGLRNRGKFGAGGGGGGINYSTASQSQLTAALAEAEQDIQRAQNQLNRIQEALANRNADL